MNRHERRGDVGWIIVILFVLVAVAILTGVGGWFLYNDWRVNNEFLPVEATIITSEVGVHSDSDGTTYYPDIAFSYEVDGNLYSSGNYRNDGVSSSGRSSKQRIVRQYAVGSKHEAWYDPQKPSVAVLNRDYGLFGFIFGGIGIAIPLIGIVVMVTRAGRARSRRSAFHDMGITTPGHILSQVSTKGMQMLGDGRVQLRGAVAGKGLARGLLALVTALFWNGITWTITMLVLSQEGLAKWGPLAFLSIFILVGAWLAIKAIWALLQAVAVARAISSPVLTIDRLPLRLGEKFKVVYEQQTRKPYKIYKVTVTLTCKEWVQYTVGTVTRTAEHTVSEQEELLSQTAQVHAGDQVCGEAEFDIPAEAMQSFDGSSNKIKWSLNVRAVIARWPDYADDIAIAVSPCIVAERS